MHWSFDTSLILLCGASTYFCTIFWCNVQGRGWALQFASEELKATPVRSSHVLLNSVLRSYEATES